MRPTANGRCPATVVGGSALRRAVRRDVEAPGRGAAVGRGGAPGPATGARHGLSGVPVLGDDVAERAICGRLGTPTVERLDVVGHAADLASVRWCPRRRTTPREPSVMTVLTMPLTMHALRLPRRGTERLPAREAARDRPGGLGEGAAPAILRGNGRTGPVRLVSLKEAAVRPAHPSGWTGPRRIRSRSESAVASSQSASIHHVAPARW
jgi:hypothetical protein